MRGRPSAKEGKPEAHPHEAGALKECRGGGAGRDRTDDLRLAKPALSQLSYSPKIRVRGREGRRPMVGLDGFEPSTSRLSGGRSNQLSYRPGFGASAPMLGPRKTE